MEASSDPLKIEVSTEPLTLEILQATIKRALARRPPEPEPTRIQCCDVKKLAEIGFRSFYDPMMGMDLTSSTEMRRAIDAGAIWYEDRDGNRLP